MLNFIQVNLHKAAQATILAGQGMLNQTQAVYLLTEPHTVAGRITGMPNGTTVIYHRASSQSATPRAGIVATKGLGLVPMEKWCSRDCAAAFTYICLLYTSDAADE